MSSIGPNVDAGVRERLIIRFGSEVEAWFDELPDVLASLADRWQLEQRLKHAENQLAVSGR